MDWFNKDGSPKTGQNNEIQGKIKYSLEKLVADIGARMGRTRSSGRMRC